LHEEREKIDMNETSSTLFDQFLKTFRDPISTSLSIFGTIFTVLAFALPAPIAKLVLGGIALLLVGIWIYRFYVFRKSLRKQKPVSLVDLSNAALRGLLPFEEGEHLFGRDLDVMRIMPILDASEFRYGVLSGDSGCGKTSLVRAGLLPQLRKHHFIPLYLPSPMKDPRNTVREAAKNEFPDLQNEQKDIIDALDAMAREEDKKVVIIFDQFEEFFLLNPGTENRRAFARWLGKVINHNGLHVSFLLVVRRDFFGELHDFYPSISEPTPARYCYRLHNFEHEQSREILIQSAAADGRIIPGLFADEIIEGLKVDGYIRPAELQIVGSQIIAKRIGEDEFEAAGRSEGILRNFVSDMIKSSPHERASSIILRMMCAENGITKGPIDLSFEQIHEAVKNDAALSGELKLNREFVERILKFFIQTRIIVLTRENAYNLVHDYLAPRIFEATNSEETNTERANRLLKRYITLYRDDEKITLPFEYYTQIKKYASPELKKQDVSARLIRSSEKSYTFRRTIRISTSAAVAMALVGVILLYFNLAYLSIEPAANADQSPKVVVRRGMPMFDGLWKIGDILLETDYLLSNISTVSVNSQIPADLIKYEQLRPVFRNDFLFRQPDAWSNQLASNLSPRDRFLSYARLGQEQEAKQILLGTELYGDWIGSFWYDNGRLLEPELVTPEVIAQWKLVAGAQGASVDNRIAAIRSLLFLSKMAPEKYYFETGYVKTLYNLARGDPKNQNLQIPALRGLMEAGEYYPGLMDREILDYLVSYAIDPTCPVWFSAMIFQYLPGLAQNQPPAVLETYSSDFLKYFLDDPTRLQNVNVFDSAKLLADRQWPALLEARIRNVGSGKEENISGILTMTNAALTAHPEVFSTEWKDFLLASFQELSGRDPLTELSEPEGLVPELLLLTLYQKPGLFSPAEERAVIDFTAQYAEAFPKQVASACSPTPLVCESGFSKAFTVDRMIARLKDYKKQLKDSRPPKTADLEEDINSYSGLIYPIFYNHPSVFNQEWVDFLYAELKARALSDYPKAAEMTAYDNVVAGLYTSTRGYRPELFKNSTDEQISADLLASQIDKLTTQAPGTFNWAYYNAFLANATPRALVDLQELAIARYRARQHALEQDASLKKPVTYAPYTCDTEMAAALTILSQPIYPSGGADISRETIDFLVAETLSDNADCQGNTLGILTNLLYWRSEFLDAALLDDLIASAGTHRENNFQFTNFFSTVAQKRPEFLDTHGSRMLAAINDRGYELDPNQPPSYVLSQIWPLGFAAVTPPANAFHDFMDYLLSRTTIAIGPEYLNNSNALYPVYSMDQYLANSSEETWGKMFAACTQALSSPKSMVRRNGARLCVLLALNDADMRQDLEQKLQSLRKSIHPESRVNAVRAGEMLDILELDAEVRANPSRYAAARVRLNYLAVNGDPEITAAAQYTLNKIETWHTQLLLEEEGQGVP
jgi:hypothetical protein